MPALVGLLLVVFVIAGLLVYEAWNTGRSRREIAERGLQDYAAYASWSTARAGESVLAGSLSTIFRGIAGNRISETEPVAPISSLVAGADYLDQCECAMPLPADYFFRFDARTGNVDVIPARVKAPEQKIETGWAAAKVGSYTPQSERKLLEPDAEWLRTELSDARLESLPSFSLRLVNHDDSALAVGLAPQRDSTGKVMGALGFVTSARRFADATFSHLWRNPGILPLAITRGIQAGNVERIAKTQINAPEWLSEPIAKAAKNPDLLFYKLKTNAYKFSWMLIPLSVPFLWLLFPFSRRFRLYDHTVFVTYSMSFMTLLVVTAILIGVAGLPQIAGFAMLIPPIHMYRQLKGAYGLTPGSALARTFLLVAFSGVEIGLFLLLLFGLGLFD